MVCRDGGPGRPPLCLGTPRLSRLSSPDYGPGFHDNGELIRVLPGGGKVRGVTEVGREVDRQRARKVVRERATRIPSATGYNNFRSDTGPFTVKFTSPAPILTIQRNGHNCRHCPLTHLGQERASCLASSVFSRILCCRKFPDEEREEGQEEELERERKHKNSRKSVTWSWS